jgi:hypothetical protein
VGCLSGSGEEGNALLKNVEDKRENANGHMAA